MHQPGTDIHEGIPKTTNKTNPLPHRSPPPPPSAEPTRNVSPPSLNSRTGGGGGPLGAFWSTQHAKDSLVAEDKSEPKFDEEPSSRNTSRHDWSRTERHAFSHNTSPPKEENIHPRPVQKNVHGKSVNRSEDGPTKDFEIKFFQDGSDRGAEMFKASKSESTSAFQSEAFNNFVAEFDTNKLNPGISNKKSGMEEVLEAEVERIKEQLKQANVEKAEITSKYEKLSAICRSQRQEIQELKQALAAGTPSPSRDASKIQTSPGIRSSATPPQREKIEGTVWELQQGLLDKSSPSPDPKPWQAFAEDPKPQTMTMNTTTKSVRTRNGHQNKQAAEVTSGADAWGFGTESFTAAPSATSQISRPISELNNSQHFGESKNIERKSASQPAGWAGF
uniref:non-specific serine/threonine protein kinase n=1 Tax=Davidia involucrata TaxID=16924 RepID=A0A5B7A0H3_DAVIN